MLFNSVDFLIFFPVVVLVYYCVPKKVRYFWLLVSSYYFYMNWNVVYGVLLFFCTLGTYVGGRVIGNIAPITDKARRKRKFCLICCLMINLGLLAFFKYAGFIVNLVNKIFCMFPRNFSISWADRVILPVGISFYVLQSLGYLIDVYRQEIYAEKNFFRYALFVSFFPQLVAGPIERAKNLLMQLAKPAKPTFLNFKKGLFIMLWGFFIKVVIADRVALFVDEVYGNSSIYRGFYIVVATLLFAIQIYCDFYGYSAIARGAALFFGIKLVDNFNSPYFSENVEEFWRRWHISLSDWFKDYLYIPLGGNRRGLLRKQINRLAVFSVSGLWHGASFAFICWGFLNGFYQVAADGLKQLRVKFNIQVKGNAATFSDRFWRRIVTFILVSFAWIFFRAGGMEEAIEVLRNMLCFNWEVLVDGSLFALGISKDIFRVLLCAIGVLAYVDYKKYRGGEVAMMLAGQKWWFQMIVSVSLLLAILLFGCYGVEYDTGQFIYFQF